MMTYKECKELLEQRKLCVVYENGTYVEVYKESDFEFYYELKYDLRKLDKYVKHKYCHYDKAKSSREN